VVSAGAKCGYTVKTAMTDSPLATQPEQSFSVLASAGTGKTWQLVARLTRLLLHGAQLNSILAITFTRKAAGEMQQRLNERLRELLEADERQLDTILSGMGEKPTADIRRRARKLLEQSLRCEQNLRSTTFHSFCQELLQRFPLEAGLPPGFELAEQTGLLIQESWDALFAEATAEPEQPLAESLELLFEMLNGLHNTRSALFTFVEHRSDWWAFTQQARQPAAVATDCLRQQLEPGQQTSSSSDFWNEATRSSLGEFAALLGQHATSTNQKHLAAIENILANTEDPEGAIANIRPVFFTGSGERRKRTPSQALCKAMGERGEDRFLELHDAFCEQLEQLTEQQNRQRTLRINSAWYRAGQRMLEHYQHIKRERRLLDFADLEWNTYQLLNHPDHAHWIQFKLDQRIDHLLIDEFQDTNPTQWRLILPLLEEMAAGGERARSLFIVGDAKQSIYRFRRGNPDLLGVAAEWMQRHLQAGSIHLDHSWRSSPAVMDFVNRVFQHPDMEKLLPGFQAHTTHQNELWGRIELWPLIQTQNETHTVEYSGLRNPLQYPRPLTVDRRYYREGQAIAQRIQELIEQKTARYNDILILMRSRTHLVDYEAALRDQGIPYLSLDRGTLLQSLEIRDLEALLVVLMTPQDNLSLAHVLRSPIFSATDEDLVLLVGKSAGAWIEKLEGVSKDLDNCHPLSRAHRLLTQWRALAGRIPIHDLLERIFHESNLPNRYQAACPSTQVARVQANLTRFIELALEVDAGRYPSLPRFLERVRQLRNLEKEGPSQATPQSEHQQRVCLLTIHAAKGLEAPVVFLADSNSPGSSPPGYQTLVRWPAEADRPSDFMLLSNSRQRDSISKARYDLEQQEEMRESANLLYVALTRAKNMLVVSGCAHTSKRKSSSWYEQIAKTVCDETALSAAWIHTFKQAPVIEKAAATRETDIVDIDSRLNQPIPTHPFWQEISPSRQLQDTEIEPGSAEGRQRGLAIHRMLQLATQAQGRPFDEAGILSHVATESGLQPDAHLLQQCWNEVKTLLDNRDLAWLLTPATGARTFNEVPIQYRRGQQTVYGIIDRLVVTDVDIHLIDYKTHRIDNLSLPKQLAERYKPQLELYREGIRRLWPDHSIKTYLLLTDGGMLVNIDSLSSDSDGGTP
jgi:ATP-dependent helicase/nuclease subunit A